MGDFITYEVGGGKATVRLNRPDLHNAFNEDMMRALTRAMNAAGEEASARVVVLAAEGKSFCAGADINWMSRMVDYTREENIVDAAVMSHMLHATRECPKPVIARVHGAAFGGGVGLVAACDMAVALPKAIFCLSEVKLGIIPAMISPFVLEKMGAAARRYALTAERFDAAEARRIGLLSEVADDERAMDVWIESIVSAVKQVGPHAVAECKRVLRDVTDAAWRDVEALTTERIADVRVSAEGQEGLRSFLDKRRPAWASEDER